MQSAYSGAYHQVELPITEEEYNEGMKLYMQGCLIQAVFPQLSSDQHDFILTGMTEEEWEKLI